MAKKQSTSASVSLWTWVVVAGLAVSIALGAFMMSRQPASSKAASAKGHLVMPDHVPPEPTWLKNALQPVREAYVYAASHHDELQYIPCYCGCGAMHANNYACYFKRNGAGQVTGYDEHAYG